MTFRLKELRTKRKISQLKLALDLNMNQNTISRYENIERQADYDTLIKFADYFGVSVDYLLGNEEQKETSPAAMTEDEELQYVLEQYKNRPCLRMLFKVSDKATAKHVYQAAEQIEALTLLEEHKAADEQSAD